MAEIDQAPVAWDEIEASDSYQSLSGEDRRSVKLGWFHDNIAPSPQYQGLSEDERGLVVDGFFSEPRAEREPPSVWGTVKLGARGAVEGVSTELPKMVGEALEFVGVEGLGKPLSDWAEQKAVEWYGEAPQDLNWVETAVYEGAKMIAPSVIPAGLLATGTRAMLGIGNLTRAARAAMAAGDVLKAQRLMAQANRAAKISTAVASGGVAGLFGASQAQNTLDNAEAQAKKLEREGRFDEAAQVRSRAKYAAYLTGGIEAAGEYLGTKYLSKLFGLDEAEVIKRGAKELLTNFLKTLGVEVSTEVGQQAGQATVEKYTAIRPEAEPLAEALDVVGPTVFMTMVTGGLGIGAQKALGIDKPPPPAPPPQQEAGPPIPAGDSLIGGTTQAPEVFGRDINAPEDFVLTAKDAAESFFGVGGVDEATTMAERTGVRPRSHKMASDMVEALEADRIERIRADFERPRTVETDIDPLQVQRELWRHAGRTQPDRAEGRGTQIGLLDPEQRHLDLIETARQRRMDEGFDLSPGPLVEIGPNEAARMLHEEQTRHAQGLPLYLGQKNRDYLQGIVDHQDVTVLAATPEGELVEVARWVEPAIGPAAEQSQSTPDLSEGQVSGETGGEYSVQTEDLGQVQVGVIRRDDGSVTLVHRDGDTPPIKHNAEFAKGKTDVDLIKYSYEPFGFQSANLMAEPTEPQTGVTPVEEPTEEVGEAPVGGARAPQGETPEITIEEEPEAPAPKGAADEIDELSMDDIDAILDEEEPGETPVAGPRAETPEAPAQTGALPTPEAPPGWTRVQPEGTGATYYYNSDSSRAVSVVHGEGKYEVLDDPFNSPESLGNFDTLEQAIAAAEGRRPAPPTTGPRAPTTGPKAPTGPTTRSAGDIIKDAAEHGVKGVDEALKGLYDLFGGGSLKSFPGGIDEDTYNKAKPHFEKVLAEWQAAGRDLRDLVRFLYEKFGGAIKPYLRHWIESKKVAGPEPETPDETGSTEGPRAPKGGEIKIETPEDEEDKKGGKKKGPKLQDVGEALGGKRAGMNHGDRTKAIEIELDRDLPTDASSEEIVAALKKITNKANLFKVDHGIEERTPGTIRYLKGLRGLFYSWFQREGRRHGGGVGKYSASFGTALARAVEQGGDVLERIKKSASAYISAMEQINEAIKDVTKVGDAHHSIMKTLYGDTKGTEWYIDADAYKEQVSRYRPLTGDHVTDTADALHDYVRKQHGLHSYLGEGWMAHARNETEADRNQPIRRIGRQIFDIETPDKYRNGKDMRGEDLMKTFGLRGVDYGNWAEADFRQRSVNLTYDSFKMLAELLSAPDKAISINEDRRLGIGYGARGRGGKAAAAFYPDNRVIGLTKTKGDGSLAHEWGHAFDFMSLRSLMTLTYDNKSYDAIDDLKHALQYRYKLDSLEKTVEQILRGLYMNSGLRSKRLEDAKKFLKQTWQDQLRGQTDFFKNAIGLDGGARGDYWSDPVEMWSRAFEAWVADKIQGENLYLVDVDFVAPGSIETMFNRDYGAYPTDEERDRFNEIFDHFFEGVQWSDDGIPSIKDDYKPVTVHEFEQAEKAMEEMLEKVEEMFKQIYQGEPSEDGLYWYAYTQTSRGSQMQPQGYEAYDDKFVYEPAEGEEESSGTGAVGYADPQEAEELIKFGLKALTHNDNDNKVYLEVPDGSDTTGDDGSDSMEEFETDDVPGTSPQGGPRQGGIPGSGSGEGRPDGPGFTPGGEVPGGMGEGDIDLDIPGPGTGADEPRPGPAIEPLDYTITSTDELGTTTPSERFNNNLAAIRLLKQIESEDRLATAEEQKILVKYNGWGELSQALEDPKWASKSWRGRASLIREVLTEEEINEIKPSTLNAYYTPPGVINQIYETLMRFGFKGGRVLEPSVGIGHFFGMMPEQMRHNSVLTGIDRDTISARIAKQLYQSAGIIHERFEDTPLPNNFYDLAVSNVPFGPERIYDKEHNPNNYVIHDYFITKMINTLKPGGLIAVVTSTGTMDKADATARNAWAQDVDFVGAVRLPNGVYAGAQAGSDIIFLRKKVQGAPHIKSVPWEKTKTKGMPTVNSNGEAYGEGNYDLNEYFADHEDMALGTFGYYNSWQNGGVRVYGDASMVVQNMEEALKNLPDNIYIRDPKPDDLDIADRLLGSEVIKDGAYFVGEDGAIYTLENGKPVKQGKLKPPAIKRIKAMIGIRDVVRDLLRSQATKDGKEEGFRKKLNRLYKAFVKKYGPLNDAKNFRLINDDPDVGLLTSLEKWDPATERVLGLEAIFTKNTIADIRPPESAETSEDGLVYSLAWKGRVDLGYIGQLVGKSKDAVVTELQGKIYDDPEKGWVTADEYLSGNVRAKLKTAQAAAKQDKKYEANVAMLKAVMPRDLGRHEIRIKMGAGWVPRRFYEAFVSELFRNSINGFRLDYTWVNGKWRQSWRGNTKAQQKRNRDHAVGTVQATSRFGTRRKNFFKVGNSQGILDYALNGEFPKIYDPIYDEQGRQVGQVLNERETDAAGNKVEIVQKQFNRWIWENESRAKELVGLYNEIFNSYVDREYNGDHLTFPGKVPDEIIKLRDHQKAAVWRYLQTGSTYFAHEVGTGKTYTMIASIMEAKRLGLAHKAIIAVKLKTMDQIRADFLKLYPGANVLMLSIAANKKQRKKDLTRIALGDWDAVIVNHDSFKRIPLSPETERQFIETEIRKARAALQAANRTGAARYTVRDIERRIQYLEGRLRRARDQERLDIPNMEEMGIDMLVVDEAHIHKNIAFQTSYSDVKGVDPKGSAIADDLYMKTQYMHNRFGRGILLASGTPLTNSVGELFNIGRYLQPQEMSSMGFSHFDAWANTFGVMRQEAEYAPSGGGFKMTQRFAEFINIPDLMSMMRQAMDIKTAEEININRPEVEGGSPEKVKVEQSPYVEAFQDIIRYRVQNFRANGRDAMWEGHQDNMLNIVNDGRLVAMDARLYDPQAPDHPQSKTNVGVEKILDIYAKPVAATRVEVDEKTGKETKTPYMEKNHVQLVFADRGVPDGQGFNLYADIKKKLIAKGVPAKEIAFAHDFKGKEVQYFRKINDGKIRVVIGSTGLMGIGVNIQRRVSAMHHLDVDWTYANYEQRNGRGWRYGNMVDVVRILNYGTVKTVDAFMWSTVAFKEKVLGQVLSNDPKVRHIEDISQTSMEASEMEALLSDDPLHKEKMELEVAVRKLRNVEADFEYAKRRAEERLAQIPYEIEAREASRDNNQKHLETAEKITAIRVGDKFYELKTRGGEANKAAVEMMESLTAGKTYIGEFGYVVKETVPTLKVVKDKKTGEEKEIKGEKEVKVFKAVPLASLLREFHIENGKKINEFQYIIGPDVRYTYDPERGISRGLTNIINSLKANIDEAAKQIDSLKKEIPEQEKIKAKNFEQADELREKEVRLRTVTEQLLDQQAEEDANLRAGAGQEREAAVDAIIQSRTTGVFHAFAGDEQGFVPIASAKKVKLVPWGEFFVHKAIADKNRWSVSEAKSGVMVSLADTRNEAIDSAKKQLEDFGETKFKGSVKKFISEKGESPYDPTAVSDFSALESARNALKNQDGFSAVHNHLLIVSADIIRRGYDKFTAFRRELKRLFREFWDQIKRHAKTLFNEAKRVINNERGSISFADSYGPDRPQQEPTQEPEPEPEPEEPTETTPTYEDSRSPITPNDYRVARETTRGTRTKGIQALQTLKRDAKKEVSRLVVPVSTRLRKVSRKLAARLRTMEFGIAKGSQGYKKEVLPLLQAVKNAKMSRDDAADWDYARKNSDKAKIESLVKKYGLEAEYARARRALKKIRDEAVDVGLDIGEIKEYWPRKLSDVAGFLKAMEKQMDGFNDVFSRALRKRADELEITVGDMDPEMRANIISDVLLGRPTGLEGISFAKSRVFRKIPPELNQYYLHSDAAILAYVHEMKTAIEKRKFFGRIPKKIAKMRGQLFKVQNQIRELNKILDVEQGRLEVKDDKVKRKRNRLIQKEIELRAYLDKYKRQRDYTENISSLIDELIVQGEIKPNDQAEVREALSARFHDKSSYGFWHTYKNLSYIDTMGSPISALTQIGDLAWVMYNTGVVPALKAAGKSLLGKARITREDVGVSYVAQEFSDPGTLAKSVGWVFRAVGLEKIDAIGKEALLNATYEKYRKQAMNNPGKLAAEIEAIFEGETREVIDDLANDEITDNVKLLVYHRLLDFQPVALSEMPQRYLTSGNGRVFYMLKTFTIKQFDTFRNEALSKIKNGSRQEKIQGVKNLIRLSMFFVLANAGADELKDWILGRKTDFRDRVVDNILRLGGASKFIVWKARTEGYGSAAARQVLPPFKFIDAISKDIYNAGDDKGLEIVASVPLIGKLAYWHMGRGVSKRGDLWDRRLSKRRRELRRITERYQRSTDKAAFRNKYRQELLEHRQLNRFQGRLNKLRRRINLLKARPQTEATKKRIKSLEDRRTELIKKRLTR